MKKPWVNELDERELKELALCRYYAKLGHGTSGHNRMMLIAKLASLLDESTSCQCCGPDDGQGSDSLEGTLKRVQERRGIVPSPEKT